MPPAKVSNPNDHRVVTFTNKEQFGFTPEMGCMYDSRPIFGITGAPGINAGESIVLPYHVGNLLARNLAKVAMTRQAPSVDPAGIPTGVPLWDEPKLNRLQASYLTDLYMEQTPVQMSETDRLMAKVEEYKAMVDKLIPKQEESKPEAPQEPVVSDTTTVTTQTPAVYTDKAEVIAELTKRGIKFDARQNKANLEKLLA